MIMNRRNKRGAVPFIVMAIGIVLALGVIASTFGFDIASITGGFDPNGIYVADNGRLECLSSPTEVTTYSFDNDKVIVCPDNLLLDNGCTIKITEGAGRYYIDGGSGVSFDAGIRGDTIKLNSGQYVKISPAYGFAFLSKLDVKAERTYVQYRLYTVERGAKVISSSSDCCLANQNQLQKKQFELGDWDCLNKGGIRNYFLNWEKVYGAKVYDGKICTNNALYAIDTVKLEDGSTVNMQGSKIKNVECCPHQDDNCNSNTFTFNQRGEEETRECTYDYQCANGGNPYDAPFTSTKANIQKCVSGECVESQISIECDSDAKCRQLYGEGYGCDLSYDNYGKCIKVGQIEQPRCGDGICSTGETLQECPSDCTLECPEGFRQVTVESKENCVVGFPVYWGCDKVVAPECRKDSANWFMWFVLGLITILIIIFRNHIMAVLRTLLNKIGVKI